MKCENVRYEKRSSTLTRRSGDVGKVKATFAPSFAWTLSMPPPVAFPHVWTDEAGLASDEIARKGTRIYSELETACVDGEETLAVSQAE